MMRVKWHGATTRRRTLQAIADYFAANGYAPTIRELCELMGISSTSLMNYHLNKLVDRGLLTRQKSIARAMTITDAGKRALNTNWRTQGF